MPEKMEDFDCAMFFNKLHNVFLPDMKTAIQIFRNCYARKVLSDNLSKITNEIILSF